MIVVQNAISIHPPNDLRSIYFVHLVLRTDKPKEDVLQVQVLRSHIPETTTEEEPFVLGYIQLIKPKDTALSVFSSAIQRWFGELNLGFVNGDFHQALMQCYEMAHKNQ